MLALRAVRVARCVPRLVAGRAAGMSPPWGGTAAARGPAVRGLCAPAPEGDDSKEKGETLLYDNYHPVFANVVLCGTAAHTGFWVWAIKMNEKITEIHGQEVLNIWYDYAGLFASGVILSLAVLWKRRTVAQVAQIDAYNARIGTYALLTGIASSVVPIHTLSMHPHGMRDYYMVKTGDDATYMMLSKKGKHYDKARLLDVLNGRPSAPSGHSREEEEKRAAEPLQRLGRGPGKRK